MADATVTLHRTDWLAIIEACDQLARFGFPNKRPFAQAVVDFVRRELELCDAEFVSITRDERRLTELVALISHENQRRYHLHAYWAGWRLGEQIGITAPQS